MLVVPDVLAEQVCKGGLRNSQLQPLHGVGCFEAGLAGLADALGYEILDLELVAHFL